MNPASQTGTTEHTNIHARMSLFIRRYMALPDERWADVLALWAIGTWVYMTTFDAYPYLVVTSATKRSGKTRLGAELLPLLCNNPVPSGAITPAAMFRSITEDKENGITLGFDESEKLFSESSGLREFLNMGYKRGQQIIRTGKDGVQRFEVYCPKIFILIGDVYDTLRDRSIVIEMVRASNEQVRGLDIWRSDRVKAEADALLTGWNADTFAAQIDESLIDQSFDDALTFLDSRDAEIWTPIFTLARCFCPEKLSSIRRVAADLAAAKTADARRASELKKAEDKKADESYAEKCVRDMAAIVTESGARFLASDEAIEALKSIDVAPWRTYRGTGLNAHLLAHLLSSFGLKPKVIRVNKTTTARGYQAADILRALGKAGGQ